MCFEKPENVGKKGQLRAIIARSKAVAVGMWCESWTVATEFIEGNVHLFSCISFSSRTGIPLLTNNFL